MKKENLKANGSLARLVVLAMLLMFTLLLTACSDTDDEADAEFLLSTEVYEISGTIATTTTFESGSNTDAYEILSNAGIFASPASGGAATIDVKEDRITLVCPDGNGNSVTFSIKLVNFDSNWLDYDGFQDVVDDDDDLEAEVKNKMKANLATWIREQRDAGGDWTVKSATRKADITLF